MRENSTTPLYLKVGDNNVIFNEKSTRLTITPNEGYKLTCLRSGDKDYLSEYSSYSQSIRVEEGMVLEIEVEPLEQITNVVYFDTTEGLNPGDLVNDSWEDYVFSQGYNVYTLFEGHNSFLFMPSATPAGIYLNGVQQESKYGDSWLFYEFVPERNDVIKVFMLAEPEIYRLTFEPTTVGDDGCSIFYDMVIPVEDTVTPLELLGRTYVTVVPETADDTFSVIANDIVVMPDADGVYTIDITGDTTLKYGSTSGIVSNQGSARSNHVKNVYNLQGILILSDATELEISELPVGLYIIDGQKRYVRN